EALAFSYWRSFGLPVTITRTMNLIGERQHPEKFVPMVMRRVLRDELITIHGSPTGISGSRKWLHCRNQADALLFLLKAQRSVNTLGETFHIAGEEKTNLEMAEMIAGCLRLQPRYEIVDAHSARPGHDLRYSLDDSKLRSLGWKPPLTLADSLRRTIEWTMQPENLHWLGGDLSGWAASQAGEPHRVVSGLS